MIIEVCDIQIHPNQQTAFEAAIQHGIEAVAADAKGFRGHKLNRGIESPERYILQICWDTLEDHTILFREGPLSSQWRAIVGPFAVRPPVIEHFEPLQ